MKQVKCEMCGSTDMMKQNGVFVCQSCGMKYSVENKKKMMIEGVVEVTGTVSVDKTNDLQNWLTLARRAKNSDDANNAFKYYSLIHEQEPTNWEAWFYFYYYQLFVHRNVPTPFANEIDDILKAMWSQVNEQDRKNTVTEIITMLNKSIMLCTKYEDTYKIVGSRIIDIKKSLDFEFVMFLLLYNVIVSIKGKGDTYTELLTSLSLNALKVAKVFSDESFYGEGYTLEVLELRKNLQLSEDHKERRNDIEMMIINIVDFLISNHVSPQGFGSVYCCKSEDDKDYHRDLYRGDLMVNHYSPIFKGQLIWLGSKAILENIKNKIELLNSNCRPWDFSKTEEYNRNRISEYNKELTQLVNKAKLFQKDFESPNYYEQHPLPTTDGETLKQIIKELKDLNENYKKNFKLENITLSSNILYSPEQAYSLRYDKIKEQIDKYNKKYERDYNSLLEQAIKFDSQFTFPNLVKTNPLKVEHFLERPDPIQSAIDEIQYAWKREGCFGFIGLLFGGVISCLIALCLGCFGGNDKDAAWIFFLAIGCGLFFRFVFKDLFGHKGITLFAILSAIIAVVLWNVVFLSEPEMNNGMMYIVLLVYTICL